MNIVVNGRTFVAKAGSTILDVCKENNIYVPTMCFFEGLPAATKCGLCVVKVNGSAYCQACITPIQNNMVIETNTPDVISKTQAALDRFIDMSYPPPSKDIEDIYKYLYPKKTVRIRQAEVTNSVRFDPESCIQCQRCVRICSDVQSIDALNDQTQKLRNNSCIGCGLCTVVCPTDAFLEAPSTPRVFRALGSGYCVCLLISPSVFVTLPELLGNKPDFAGRIISAAKQMGFDFVFDEACGIDVAVYEEAAELIERISTKTNLPLFSSNCPAWVNFVEKHHPEIIPNLATVKSPHVILGRLVKKKVSMLKKISQQSIFVVSLLGCTAAKDEIKRMQLAGEIDAVITPREFVQMMKTYAIEISATKPYKFDAPFNICSRSAVLDELPGHHAAYVLKMCQAQGESQSLFIGKGIVDTTFNVGGRAIKIAICSGVSNARDLIETGRYKEYSYIEVLACPYGCSGGGGQPRIKGYSIMETRVSALNNYSLEYPELGTLPLSEPMFRTHFEPQESVALTRVRRPLRLPIIAYGSSYDSTQAYARIIANSYNCLSVAMNHVTMPEMIKSGVGIFLIGTQDDGGFPMNCQQFISTLSNSTESLSNFRFAICSFGDSSKQKAFEPGKFLFSVLLSKGAEPILPMATSDQYKPDQASIVVEKWGMKLSQELGARPPRFGIRLVYSVAPSDDRSIIDHPLRPVGFEIAELVSTTRVTPDSVIPPMHQHIILLPPGTDYETGDHFSILPENNPEMTNTVIESLGLQSNDIYTITSTRDTIRSFIPEKVTILQLFRQYIDLNGPVDRFLVQAFYDSGDSNIQRQLQGMIDDETVLTEQTADVNIGEFILKYAPQSKPDLARLLSACPHIQPRTFSIASSPSSNRGYLELLVQSVLFGPNNSRRGLATYFLQRPGVKRIAIRCHKGVFKYPSDKGTPILLCGVGSGLAPILAVLQHRATLHIPTLGNAVLFFGARFRTSFPLLLKRLADLKSKEAVNDIYTAFSRGDPKPAYIQDIMRENKARIWSIWQDPRTVLYYCGPRRGIPDDIREILINITMSEGNMPREYAEEYCQHHQFILEAQG